MSTLVVHGRFIMVALPDNDKKAPELQSAGFYIFSKLRNIVDWCHLSSWFQRFTYWWESHVSLYQRIYIRLYRFSKVPAERRSWKCSILLLKRASKVGLKISIVSKLVIIISFMIHNKLVKDAAEAVERVENHKVKYRCVLRWIAFISLEVWLSFRQDGHWINIVIK